MAMSQNWYVVYDKKSDSILVTGYAEECARSLGMTLHSFYSLVSRVKKGTNNKYEVSIDNLYHRQF